MPAKVFFPERKDLPPDCGDLRRNLITVPSCKAHNSSLSKEDEVVAFAMLLLAEKNRVGEDHFATKVLRALRRKRSLVPAIIKEITVVRHPDGTETGFAEIDDKRVYPAMERAARGIYYHRFGSVLRHELGVFSPQLRFPGNLPNPQRTLEPQLRTQFAEKKRIGENAAVFYYQAIRYPSGSCAMHWVFYEGVHWYAVTMDGQASGRVGPAGRGK